MRHNINCVHTLRRIYNRHPSEQNKFKLEASEKLLQTEINNPSPPDVIDHPSMISELSISDDEVLNVLLDLDTTKAMGSDGIPPIVLQRCALALYQPLSYLFNLTLQFSYLPSN